MKRFILFSITVIFLMACNSDPCEDKDCGEFGTCMEGVCICEQFYEGENCEKETRTRYIGNWISSISCDDGINSTGLDFEIIAGDGLNGIKIQSPDIYSNIQFDGFIDNENNVDIPRFRGPGINYFFGNIEDLGNDNIRMCITHETTNEKCTFDLEK